MEIKDIGSIAKIDAEGNIINEASLDKIQNKWKEVVDDMVEAEKKMLEDKILCIYVRGSVAKGMAVDDLSDVDTLTILDVSVDELYKLNFDWVKEEKKKIAEKYPFIEDTEFIFLSKEDIRLGDVFLIKTSAVCVCGEDILKNTPPVKLSYENLSKLKGALEKGINKVIEKINNTDDEDVIKGELTWICKKILRRGVWIVALKGQEYTRDLYPAHKIFSKYYPEKKPEIRQTLEWAINPIKDKEKITSFLQDFGMWVVEEDKRVFSD